jgi:hypothetical protein
MKRSRPFIGALLAGLLALVGSVVLTDPASASAGAEPVPGRARIHAVADGEGAAWGMQLVDFDVAVARAHGFEVVTLPDGSRASVPAAKADAAVTGRYVPTSGVIPAGAVAKGGGASTADRGEAVGDCGMSWVSLDAMGGSQALLITGMVLVPDAGDPWDVHWKVRIDDNGGDSTQTYDEYDGFSGFLSWTSYARWLGLTPGLAFATVNWWQSYTITESGWVCWSAGPYAWADIV